MLGSALNSRNTCMTLMRCHKVQAGCVPASHSFWSCLTECGSAVQAELLTVDPAPCKDFAMPGPKAASALHLLLGLWHTLLTGAWTKPPPYSLVHQVLEMTSSAAVAAAAAIVKCLSHQPAKVVAQTGRALISSASKRPQQHTARQT